MLIASSSSFGRLQLGQVAATSAEQAALPGITNRGFALSAQENQLRSSFAQLIPDLTALQVANANIPSELLDLLRAYNNAVASYMEATKVWLQARAETPKTDLPDPDAQPVAVPTFDIPTGGLGAFFGAGVPASALKIRYGFVGKEVTSSLSGYSNTGFAGYFSGGHNGGGFGFPVIPLFWLLGVAFVSVAIVLVVRSLVRSDTAIANQAITEQTKSRVEEVKSDTGLFVSTRDACIGNSQDVEVRRQCIAAAVDVLKIAKSGRPGITRPISPVTVSILTVLGVVAVAGTATGVGYWLYKRGEHGGGRSLPRATARSRSRGYNVDDMGF